MIKHSHCKKSSIQLPKYIHKRSNKKRVVLHFDLPAVELTEVVSVDFPSPSPVLAVCTESVSAGLVTPSMLPSTCPSHPAYSPSAAQCWHHLQIPGTPGPSTRPPRSSASHRTSYLGLRWDGLLQIHSSSIILVRRLLSVQRNHFKNLPKLTKYDNKWSVPYAV